MCFLLIGFIFLSLFIIAKYNGMMFHFLFWFRLANMIVIVLSFAPPNAVLPFWYLGGVVSALLEKL